MTKATHSGSCQLCGKLHKLPGDLVSNHGYTVNWSMFVGICPGSKGLPYERSCDLIKSHLGGLEDQIQRAESRLAIEKNRTGPIGWYLAYGKPHPAALKKEYYWALVEYFFSDHGSLAVRFEDGSKVDRVLCGNTFTDPSQAAKVQGQKYQKDVIEANLRNLRSYRSWLIDRINNWELKPLTLIQN